MNAHTRNSALIAGSRAVLTALGPCIVILFLLGTQRSLADPAKQISPVVSGDEAIVVTHHQIKTSTGMLGYEARAGRLAIRDDASNEVKGYIFFVAYIADGPEDSRRPLLFAWNGGPGGDSLLVHTRLFGPRRIDGDKFVDNPETVLRVADLVVYDAMGTGFSRLSRPELAKEFYSITADFAVTAEFIREYRARFDAGERPLVLAGESLGTWRACGTAELLAHDGVPVAGLVLLSGGLVGIPKTFAFEDAMFVPAKTEAAFSFNKLVPELMQDLATTRKKAADWAVNVYWPALEHVNALGAEARNQIVEQLAYFTGVDASMIDRKTLIMTNTEFRETLLGKNKVLNSHNLREVGPDVKTPGEVLATQHYLRQELAFATDLSYAASLYSLEKGFVPAAVVPYGPNATWNWNQVKMTPVMVRRMEKDGAPPPGAHAWMENAMRLEPALKVFIAAGRADPQVSCTGNAVLVQTLPPDLGPRFTNKCYEGGHMMYRVDHSRIELSEDLSAFISSLKY